MKYILPIQQNRSTQFSSFAYAEWVVLRAARITHDTVLLQYVGIGTRYQVDTYIFYRQQKVYVRNI